MIEGIERQHVQDGEKRAPEILVAPPWKVPGSAGSRSATSSRPGMAETCSFSSGTVHSWMMSSEVNWRRVRSPAGRTSGFETVHDPSPSSDRRY